MLHRTSRTLFLLTALVALVPAAAGAEKIDLGPDAWPPGDLEYYTALQNENRRPHPPITTRRGLVVGTTGALAVRAGVEALRQGGTAVDAALTTSLAQITLMAGATVSFAGALSLVHYEAETGEIRYLNGFWDVPRGQVSGSDIPRCGTPSGRQVLVSGFMAALEEAHAGYGVLPFKSLFGPAIYFAREGFEVFPMLGYWIEARAPVITRLQGGRQVFLKPDGTIYRTGDWFTQPRLAKTLKRVSRKGSRYMYTGRWGRRLERLVQAEGGRLAGEDLAAYEPRWLAPETFDFAGHRLHGTSPPSYGGANLRRAMTGLSTQDLVAAGHYTSSADALEAMLEAVERRFRLPSVPGAHSDGVLAIDRAGNVAALLHTINTNLWGDTGIFVDGVSIADIGCYAQQAITRAGPGGRLETSENPLIVTRRGRPVAATSAVGSGLFEATFYSLVNLLAYGMGPQEAVETPTFHLCGFSGYRVVHRAVVGEFDPDLLEAVRDRGFLVDQLPESLIRRGWWIAATLDRRGDRRIGATTGAWNGLALAE